MSLFNIFCKRTAQYGIENNKNEGKDLKHESLGGSSGEQNICH